MVISKLTGGLGNQMFQYAAGRRLAYVRGGVSLKLDLSEYEYNKERAYMLGNFNVKAVLATPEEIKALKYRKRDIVSRLLQKLGLLKKKSLELSSSYIREKERFRFDANILNLHDGVYLDGSWQDERYFSGISEIISKEFTLNTIFIGRDKMLEERIRTCNSVGLHIRRGDYVSKVHTNMLHGVCDMDYYLRAMEYLKRQFGDVKIFVFSDDVKWAYEHMAFPWVTFVDHNGQDKCCEDLWLLSRCKHNIIANSTFSWWAAWLNPNPKKIIISPQHWIRSDRYDTSHLLPSTWIKM